MNGQDSYTADPSSDEEEKARSRSAKKARTKSGSPPPLQQAPKEASKGTVCTEKKATRHVKPSSNSSNVPTGSKSSKAGDATSVGLGRLGKPVRMDPQRNPSIFGEELPHLHIPSSNSQGPALGSSTVGIMHSSRPLPDVPTANPPTARVRTLRRVKRIQAPSRRISFGSLAAPISGEDADVEGEEGDEVELGSAFQLQ